MNQLREVLRPHFEVLGEFGSDARACWEHVELEGSQSVLGFGTAADGRWFAVRLTDAAVMASVAPGRSTDWQALAVSILHELVLGRLLADRGTVTCRYVHRLDEVTAALAAGDCPVAVLVPPVTMEHVQAIARNRETMPPKTTYFHPKLLTGLVLNSLKKD